MSKNQEIIWSATDVQVGIPIGYEVDFSSNNYFRPINYTISTYKEISASVNVFFYSLDLGVTWISFPKQGQIFTTPYMMKVIVNVGESSNIYCEKYGAVYLVSGDGSEILDTYVIGSFNSTGFSIDRNNNLYVSGQNKTAYKINTKNGLEDDKSINIRSNPLSIVVDSGRDFLWQIDKKSLYLKDLYGSTISSMALPFEIDVDYSSSSSSSSSSSVSSASSNSSSSNSSSSVSSNSSSSMSSESSSSSSSSVDTIYVCGEGIVPDCTGVYNLSGTYNGQPAYTDSVLWIWFESITFPLKWYISTTKGDGTDSWRSDVSGVSGLLSLYSPTPGSSYIGSPTVQQTPCDEMSSSSSSSSQAVPVGSSFTTYADCNGEYHFGGYFGGYPYYISSDNTKYLGWGGPYLIYSWIIGDGVSALYYILTPYDSNINGTYNTYPSNVPEGTITYAPVV